MKEPDALIGKNDHDFFPKEQADFFISKDRKIIDSGELLDIPEEPISTKSGLRYVHTKKIPIFADDGIPLYLLGISEDITERKRAKEALRKSENDLKDAQRVAHTGSWDWDAATDTITWSEEYYHIYGFDPSQPPPGYEAHLKAYTAESAARLDAAVKRNMQTGEPYELDLELVRPEGPSRWITARSETKHDAQGRITGLRGTAQDITELKEATERLQKSERQLRESQQVAKLGSWYLDLITPKLDWSDETYKLFDQSPEKFSPSFDEFAQLVHPDDRETMQTSFDRALASDAFPYHVEVMIINESGRQWVMEAFGAIKRDINGKPFSIFGTAQDVTERKRAEDKINELNLNLERRVAERTAQLEAANKELEAFSYSVSHDLRTPLRAIDGFSRILLDDYAGKLDDEGKRLLSVVRDSTSQMGQLIEDILKFSRTSRLEITFSEIDMEKLAREVVEELQPADGKLQVEIEAIPPATGDRAMMRQVFVNLLSNAIKFSRSRELAMIKVGGSIEGDEAVYYVKDNGAGFDMQYVDKLFGMFQRLHAMSAFEGTGIGLAIVKRIVNRHGGRVWAEGKVNGGATIYFALPNKKRNMDEQDRQDKKLN